MNALVTGGAGFIGSNVVKLLLENGHNVTVYDNLSSGHFINIKQYVKDGKISFINADVLDSEQIKLACKNIDVVFHLAACVGRQKSIDDPILDSSVNLLGTINVLEAMKENSVKKIVYSSSAAMFGELMTPTIDESHPQNADSPYGVSKLAAEKMILAYAGIYDIQAVCLRYFNIYGINQRYDLYGNVIPIFAKRIYSGEPITIFGDGNQTRDFVYVSDIARANYVAAMQANETNVYNLGSGDSITINRLAEMMQDIAGIQVGIHHAPERPADVKHCKADANKVFNHLGFKAEMSLAEGLAMYMKWYKENCL